ncbi:hypothetical protein ACJ41O_005525 [Fusarium nematophilum]
MAAADSPVWGFGQLPMEIKPVATSFVSYFPTCDSTTETNKMPFGANLSAPTPHIRLPAWERVSIQPHPATGRTAQIMKRVGLCARRHVAILPVAPPPPVVPEVPEPPVEDIAFDETLRRIRRRGFRYKPVQADVEFVGEASTCAEVVNTFMVGKVDTTNNFMKTSSSTTLEDKQMARIGRFVQVCPRKRYAGEEFPEPMGPTGGNKLPLYREILPIIKRAMRKGLTEVDLTTASIAEASTIMRQMRRDPRQPLAAFGASELSDIMDITEPESPTLIRHPILKAESRSPQKRIARLTSPIKNGMRRLTNSVVKLVPGSSPKASPSPTKSDSVPFTPLKQSPSPVKPAITPIGIDSSPLSRTAMTARENLSTESVEQTTPQPGLVFHVPSYADSSSFGSSMPVAQESPSVHELSPVKYARPVAPTPSRWNRAEPTTPQPFTPMPTIAAFSPAPVTPSQTDSPIGLASFLPPNTPQLAKFTFTPPGAAAFNFGEVSPSFNSISWMNTSVQASEPKRIKNVNAARRRQSEPLLRKYALSQARRRSSSPQKLRFRDNDIFNDDISIGAFFASVCSTPAKPTAEATADETIADEDVPMAVEVEPVEEPAIDAVAPTEAAPIEHDIAMDAADEPTPDAVTAPVEAAPTEDIAMEVPATEEPATDVVAPTDVVPIEEDIVRDAVEPAKADDAEDNTVEPTQVEPTAADNPSPAPANSHHGHSVTTEPGIVNIDMRQNPDIFGTHLSSPPAPVFDLSRMAKVACDGHAKVVVTEQNGRLFVRFKLSAQYGHMFPASQGFEDSQLNFSPSAISFSPRITFKGNPPAQPALSSSPTKLDETPAPSASRGLLATTSTLFASTPTQTVMSMQEPASVSAMMKTPDVTSAGVIKKRARLDDTPGFRTPELPANENTVIFGSPVVGLTPAQKSSIRGTPSIDTLLKTPDVTGLGIIRGTDKITGFETPELPQLDNTLVFAQPPTSARPASVKRITRQQSKKTPVKAADTGAVNTPKFAMPMGDADATLIVSWSDAKDTPARHQTDETSIPSSTKSEKAAFAVDETLVVSWSELPATPALKATEPVVTPQAATPKTSFTPVNQPTPKMQVTEAGNVDTTTPKNKATPPQATTTPEPKATPKATPKKTTPAQEAEPAPVADSRRQEYDSPGREYMREFIKRSRQTTTETGSPMAPAVKRQPLGARSSNTGSPHRKKRKHEADSADIQLPAKKPKAVKESDDDAKPSTPKRARRTSISRQKAELEIDMTDVPPIDDAATQPTETAEKETEEPEMDGPITRRSTRLRSQTQASGTPKSSIPTAIKLNRSGAGRNGGAILNSSVRSEQQDLTHQTRMNTRKNKGTSLLPAQVLAKYAEANQEDDSESINSSDGSTTAKSGKCVGWREPLESVQGEKPKKGKTSVKAKATQGKTGIAKPKTPSKRTTKIAENLGMVSNGTPAKPQRMTRARTRSQA